MFKPENYLYPEEYLTKNNNYLPITFVRNEEVVIEFLLPSFIDQTFVDFEGYKLSSWVTLYYMPYEDDILTKIKKCG